MDKLAIREREARQVLDAKIARELLIAIENGEDVKASAVHARIRRLQLRELNDPRSPFSPDRAQSLMQAYDRM